MAISANYPTPVTVNGFQCKNCTDVDYAKKHIDPQHPKAGPYGIDAKDDPSLQNKPAVSFGGALSSLNNSNPQSPASQSSIPTPDVGSQVDQSV